MKKELYKKNWDFILFEVDDKMIITVVFFGFVDYNRSFELLPSEETDDYESLSQLAEKIRNNYESYKDREVTPVLMNIDEEE